MSVVDFHGKTWAQSLAEFIEIYNRAASQSSSAGTLEIVHGYGSTGAGGILRTRIRSFLAKYPQSLQFQPGEDVDGNAGHTLVIPIKRLPDTGGLLAEEVWEYCARPRSVSKITGRFRRHGDPLVQQAIRTLEKQGRLRPVNKSRVKEYEAI